LKKEISEPDDIIQDKRLAGKSVYEMTYMTSGTLNLNPLMHKVRPDVKINKKPSCC